MRTGKKSEHGRISMIAVATNKKLPGNPIPGSFL